MTTYTDILRPPDRVAVFADSGVLELLDAGGVWKGDGVEVTTIPDKRGQLPILMTAPGQAVHRLRLRWHTPPHDGLRTLGDHWERGYGDLEWRGLVAERVMPWYFLTHDGHATHGYGVKTGARSFCFWQTDPEGVTLWLDVRCGGSGVQLGERRLEAATIVARQGADGVSPFHAAQAFCKALCDKPLLPKQPVYGGNNWYYAYGKSSHAEILDDSRLMASLAPSGANRPFMVIDDGWQIAGQVCGGGPWAYGNRAFPDMPRLAHEMEEIGVVPGIWMRPLLTSEHMPWEWALPAGRGTWSGDGVVLDPTVPAVLEQITEDVRGLAGWGYKLIKHDFSTYDFLGRWGFQMGAELTSSGWAFSNRSKTTAEAILDLYTAIRRGAGDALLLGCNTVGHLGAGLFEIQRTGDDTSGRDWNRTRKMGINTLAFRMPQHGTFFAVDADCAGITSEVPWDLNKQWLDLLARSGTPLFVSAAPSALGPDQLTALRAAFAIASTPQPVAEPLDWLTTTCPRHWRIGEQSEVVTYNWYGNEGASPFSE